MTSEYTVYQFFEDDSYEQVLRFVNAEQAVKSAISLSTSVGARLGTTRRVIITDGEDDITWEWKYGEGLVFPPTVAGRLK